jgi:hypothetical protein
MITRSNVSITGGVRLDHPVILSSYVSNQNPIILEWTGNLTNSAAG